MNRASSTALASLATRCNSSSFFSATVGSSLRSNMRFLQGRILPSRRGLRLFSRQRRRSLSTKLFNAYTCNFCTSSYSLYLAQRLKKSALRFTFPVNRSEVEFHHSRDEVLTPWRRCVLCQKCCKPLCCQLPARSAHLEDTIYRGWMPKLPHPTQAPISASVSRSQ